MEKLRLSNGQEFDVIPMGIKNLGDIRTFEIVSNLDYRDILQQFTNTENINTIEYILADGTIDTTYMDCVGFKNIKYSPKASEEDNMIQHVYTVELSVNAVERLLKSLQSKIDKLEKENEILKQENATLKDTVDLLVLSNLETNEPINNESEVEENV